MKILLNKKILLCGILILLVIFSITTIQLFVKSGTATNEKGSTQEVKNQESTSSAESIENKGEEVKGESTTIEQNPLQVTNNKRVEKPKEENPIQIKPQTPPIPEESSDKVIGTIAPSCFGEKAVLLFAFYVNNKAIDPLKAISEGILKSPLDSYKIIYGFNEVPGFVTPYVALEGNFSQNIMASMDGELTEVDTYSECNNKPGVKIPVKAKVLTSPDKNSKVIYSNVK